MQTIDRPVIPMFELGDRMRLALRHAGIGVEAIADELGYTRQAVGNWLNNRAIPRRPVLLLWAMRTGVPIEWLETGEAPDGSPDNGPGQVIDGTGWFSRSAANGPDLPELHLAATG